MLTNFSNYYDYPDELAPMAYLTTIRLRVTL